MSPAIPDPPQPAADVAARPRRAMEAGLFPLLLLVGVALPMAHGIISYLKLLPSILRAGGTPAVGGAVGALALVSAAMVSGTRRGAERIPTRLFVVLCVGVGAIAKFAYAWAVDAARISDFETMWRIAIMISRGTLPPVLSIFSDRSLPFLVPVAWAFHGAAVGYRLSNAAALMACAWLTFDLARRHFGERAARPALVLALFAPETFMASAISTHDVPGAFYLLLALWIFDRLVIWVQVRRWGAAIGSSLLLGGILELLDLQRGLLIFWIPAVCLFLFAWLLRRQGGVRQVLLWLLVCLAVPISVQKGIHGTLAARGIALSGEARAAFAAEWFAVSSDSWGDGTYEHALESYINPYRRFTLTDWRAFGRTKFLTDTIRSPVERLRCAWQKSDALYRLGSSYFLDLPPGSRSDFRWASPERLAPVLKGSNTVFVISFGVVFLMAAGRVLGKDLLPLRAWLPLLVLSILSLILITLGEVQPRYLFPIWFIAPLIVSAAFTHVSAPVDEPFGKTARAAARRILGSGAFCVLGLLVSWGILRAWLLSSDCLFIDLSEETFAAGAGSLPQCVDLLQGLQPANRAERRFRIVLRHPGIESCGARVKAVHSIRLADQAMRRLILRIHGPWRPKEPITDSFLAIVRIAGRTVARIPSAACQEVCTVRSAPFTPVGGRVELDMGIEANPYHPPGPGEQSLPVNFEFVKIERIRP